MKWFFQPRVDGDESDQPDDDSAGGIFGLPAALLQRHGARVLDPATAPLLSGVQPPQPTVYRTRTLLIPEPVVRDFGLRNPLDTALANIGLKIDAPDAHHDVAARELSEDVSRLPRSYALAPLDPQRDGNRADHQTVPVVVDAWAALQAIHADSRDPSRDKRYVHAVADVSLEHLMTGSAITGSPITEGGGGIAGGPGGSGNVSGPGCADSYLFSAADPRTPIAFLADPPARKPAGDCAADYGRRPVVAVLDTGVRAHPWLDVAADGNGGYAMAADSFVATDGDIQATICAEGLRINGSDKSRRVIQDAWDKPVAPNRLMGESNPALGHSTFIAGIVRQVAPDARVLAIRVMHSDDVAYEGDIICALGQLARRIARAEEGDLAGMVDVVSLSFGYFSESPQDGGITSGLWKAIEALLNLGVVVVAAAGNFATRRAYYPAAFARQDVPAGQVPVISVGALNPNGTKAMFSNDGPWVTAWAQGAAVMSTYPIDIDASRTPELRIPADRTPPGVLPPGRESLDPDDYACGWAIWSGTSFAAPYLAALIAAALLKGAAPRRSGLRLDLPKRRAAQGQRTPAADRRAASAAIAKRKERAAAALAELHRQQGELLLQEELRRKADHDG